VGGQELVERLAADLRSDRRRVGRVRGGQRLGELRGAAGWLVGLASGLTLNVALARALRRDPSARLGPAGWVTLIRATLAVGVAASARRGGSIRPVLHWPPRSRSATRLHHWSAADGLLADRVGLPETLVLLVIAALAVAALGGRAAATKPTMNSPDGDLRPSSRTWRLRSTRPSKTDRIGQRGDSKSRPMPAGSQR
jgi:hypothetical protein